MPPRSAHGNEEACLLSLSPWDALHLLYRHVSVLPEETVPIAEAPGRVLARPFAAPGDIPPFPRAAMDGFAVRSVDVSDASPDAPRSLRVVGHVFAGQTPSGSPLEPGEAYRIATGGEMPRGADAVLRKEGATALSDDEIAVPHPVPPGKDVVPAGAGIARDEPLYPAGWLLGINDVAVFAAYGITHVDVVRRPRVAYVETGDELVRPGKTLPEGHVYGSNGLMLSLRAREHGAEVVARRHVRDDRDAMARLFHELAEAAHIVVSTGGVSVGPRDFVPDVLTTIGFQILFQRLPIRPGYPMLAARRGDTLWIGLAGNPTAALVTHEVFVRPLIWHMGGLMFARGYLPVENIDVTGPEPVRRTATSYSLAYLHAVDGREKVRVDAHRSPTGLPAPFPFNAVAEIEGIGKGEGKAAAEGSLGKGSPEGEPTTARTVNVFPAERSLAVSRCAALPWRVGGILLAGGQSRRMGHSKLFLPLEGVPLIVRAYRALSAVAAPVRVIGAPEDAIELLARWVGDGVRHHCYPDDRPGEGPLAGLITGLRHTEEDMAVCLAADLAFVDGAALRLLLEQARFAAEAIHGRPPVPSEAFALADGDGVQPVAALYPAAAALREAEAFWEEGGRSMHGLLHRLPVVPVPAPRPLANVNRPADYAAARGALQTAPVGAGSPPPLLAFSGFSGSGKTTLLTRVIPLLVERGLRVGVIKHGRGFQLDRPGKDSWRFRQAGAHAILLYSDEEMAFMAEPSAPIPFGELAARAGQDVDVVLVEGFKRLPLPKIVVLRDDEKASDNPIVQDPHVQAVYGGLPDPDLRVPWFPKTEEGTEDPALSWIVDWIVRRLAHQGVDGPSAP